MYMPDIPPSHLEFIWNLTVLCRQPLPAEMFVSCMACVWFSFDLGLLPYPAAQRTQTCPSSGSPRTGTPLQLRSPPSALHIPTSTPTWTTSGLCTAAHLSPWSRRPGGWAPPMVSLRLSHSAAIRHTASSPCLTSDVHRIALVVSECPPCPRRCLSAEVHAFISVLRHLHDGGVITSIFRWGQQTAEGPSNLQPAPLASKLQRWNSKPDSQTQKSLLISIVLFVAHICLDWLCSFHTTWVCSSAFCSPSIEQFSVLHVWDHVYVTVH